MWHFYYALLKKPMEQHSSQFTNYEAGISKPIYRQGINLYFQISLRSIQEIWISYWIKIKKG